MPLLGPLTDAASFVGEQSGSGRFTVPQLKTYMAGNFLLLTGGDVVGPVTITQPGGVGTLTALKIERLSAVPIFNSFEYVTEQNYTVALDGTNTNHTTFNVNQTLRNTVGNAHDGLGAFIGATNGHTMVQYSELMSSAAVGPSGDGFNGSLHLNHWITSMRKLDPAFTPTDARPYAAIWGTLWNLIDDTNLSSSLGGAMLNELDIAANGLDERRGRSGLVIIMDTRRAAGAGVVPCEVAHAIAVGGRYGDSPTEGSFITTLDISGNYSVAALDLRKTRTIKTTIQTTLGAPSTVIAVNSILPFTAAGPEKAAISPANPIGVVINSNTYMCIGHALTGFGAQGTLTMTTPVSVADGTAGNVVSRNRSAAIWMQSGSTLNWDDFGNYITYFDAATGSLFTEGGQWRFGVKNQHIMLDATSVFAKSTGSTANLALFSQGAGAVQIGSAEYGGGFQIVSPAGPVVNLLTARGALAGLEPSLAVEGADADIGMSLAMKGNGVFTHIGPGGMVVGGPLKIQGAVGFNNTTPLAKPSVTGSHLNNPALVSLLTELANYGLITNNTAP
jgi:hypothetical protein